MENAISKYEKNKENKENEEKDKNNENNDSTSGDIHMVQLDVKRSNLLRAFTGATVVSILGSVSGSNALEFGICVYFRLLILCDALFILFFL